VPVVPAHTELAPRAATPVSNHHVQAHRVHTVLKAKPKTLPVKLDLPAVKAATTKVGRHHKKKPAGRTQTETVATVLTTSTANPSTTPGNQMTSSADPSSTGGASVTGSTTTATTSTTSPTSTTSTTTTSTTPTTTSNPTPQPTDGSTSGTGAPAPTPGSGDGTSTGDGSRSGAPPPAPQPTGDASGR